MEVLGITGYVSRQEFHNATMCKGFVYLPENDCFACMKDTIWNSKHWYIKRLVSDITYIKINGKWYYLCIVIDLFSRKVIAWHISAKLDVDLVISTFNKAYQKRNTPSGLMFHSDRGSQYTAFAFRQLLDSLDVVQSFSKAGFPFDNACCECFFK